MTRIDRVLDLVTGPEVLDIGCSGQAGRRSALDSPWWLHGRLLKEFPTAVGLEFDPDNVAALIAAGVPNIIEGDAQNFSLGTCFDTIVAGEVLEHLERPGDFLACARRHLKPGGRVVLTTPYVFGVGFSIYAWVKFPDTCSNSEHVAWFCPATITSLAERSGLKVQSCEVVADYRPGLSRWTGRMASIVMRTAGRLLPLRLRANSLIVVLVTNPASD